MKKFDEKFIASQDDLNKFEVVNHATELKQAIGILENGIIPKVPEPNESNINKLEASVVWVTPNEWKNQRSSFGSISFDLDWTKLSKKFNNIYVIQDNKFISNFRIPTYRLFFTNKNYKNSLIIKKYNPTRDIGPIKFDNGTWYRKNGNKIVGHFLLEIPAIHIDKISNIKFVDCGDNNRYGEGSAFLSYILFKGRDDLNRLFKIDDKYDSNIISYFNYIEIHWIQEISEKTKKNKDNGKQFGLMKLFFKNYYMSYICEDKEYTKYSDRMEKILALIGGKQECTKLFYEFINSHFKHKFYK